MLCVCPLQCSSSCQAKEAYRKVTCVDAGGIQVNENLCDPAMKPPSSRKCRAAPCKYIVITVDSSQVDVSIFGQAFYFTL